MKIIYITLIWNRIQTFFSWCSKRQISAHLSISFTKNLGKEVKGHRTHLVVRRVRLILVINIAGINMAKFFCTIDPLNEPVHLKKKKKITTKFVIVNYLLEWWTRRWSSVDNRCLRPTSLIIKKYIQPRAVKKNRSDATDKVCKYWNSVRSGLAIGIYSERLIIIYYTDLVNLEKINIK